MMADGPGGIVRDVSSLWGQISGKQAAPPPDLQPQELVNVAADDQEFVPLVLVVGATGRTGRIIVRKLVLQGFRVAVLVRSLSSDTLNLLGSGVTYSYGDMQDYQTLLDAMEDVDKIVFVASSSEPDAELEGLQNVVRAFHDTRTFMYGEAEATKLNLFKFRKDSDFDRWNIEREKGSPVGLQQVMLEGDNKAPSNPNTAVAYWKRSTTEGIDNAIFVGRVFDTFLGSAVASCDFAPRPAGPSTPGTTPGQRALAEGEVPAGELETFAPAGRLIVAEDEKAQDVADESLNFGEYSGLVLKAIGDGQRYTMIVRTPLWAETGVEYHADFASRNGSFVVARLPFSNFKPHVNGVPVTAMRGEAIPELDRRQVVGLGLAFFPQRNDPDRCDGAFYLSLSHIKTYRRRDEPEIVYLSDASVTNNAELNLDAAAPAKAKRPPRRNGKEKDEEINSKGLRSAGSATELGDDDPDFDAQLFEAEFSDEMASDAAPLGVLKDAASAASKVAQELRAFSEDGAEPSEGEQEAARAAARAAAAAQTQAAEAVAAEAVAEEAEAAAADEEAARASSGDGLASAAEGEAAAAGAAAAEEESVAVEAETSSGGLVKARGEALVRQSGLTYLILRPARLNDEPGGFARLEFSQDRVDSRRAISRADLAEVVVRSLLDPRACNLACSVSASEYAKLAGETQTQDISKMLEVMTPNKT